MNDISDRFELLDLETVQEQTKRRLKEKIEREKRLREIEAKGQCEGSSVPCNNRKDVKWIPAMTRYYWDIDENSLSDPNRDLFLCHNCANEYVECWTERWNDYYSGVL